MLRELGLEVWFNLGDRDLALCLERRRLLEAARRSARPMPTLTPRARRERPGHPDERRPGAHARSHSAGATIGLQEFLIGGARRRADRRRQSTRARPARAPRRRRWPRSRGAEAIVIGPSNPILSIGPILAVAPIRAAIEASPAPVVAVSPIVGGEVLKGPTAACMAWAGARRRRGRHRRPLRRAARRAGHRRGAGRGRPDADARHAHGLGGRAPRARIRHARPRALPARLMRTLAILPVKRFELAKTRLRERARPGRAPRARAGDGRRRARRAAGLAGTRRRARRHQREPCRGARRRRRRRDC